ncbi:MAG TPA: FHA domain-containing protein [Gemmatimonadaceae bacterium]|nr:FHA domain-containing protein [Gemmatimonadaceae bacterium]
MAFLIIDGERYALEIGETVLGGAESAFPLGVAEPQAIVSVSADGVATIERADAGARVLVDGKPAGAGPHPLRHGTRLEVGAQALSFGEMRVSGSTAHLTGVSEDALAALAALPGGESADQGGRLVGADGRAHPIPATGLTVGRDPGCDVVLSAKDASRRHATLAPGLLGYAVTDTSANGVFVNGVRVEGTRVLGRGDVVRFGSEEFRFEADAAPPPPAPRTEAALPVAVPAGSPVPRTAPPPPLLATLEIVNEGATKGLRFRITRPLAHVGRAPESDVVLRDASVSGSHAVLQRRGSAWVVTDNDSTNGTYVDGDRVTGEHALPGACELRFGNVKLVFRPIAAGAGDAPSTRGIVAARDDEAGRRGR